MKLSSLGVTLTISIVISTVSFADQIDEIIEKLPGAAKWPAQKASDLLFSDRQKIGIEKYLTMIGADASRGMNKDIVNYNAEILDSSPCISDLAAEFYYSIAADDLRGASEKRLPYFTNGISMPLSRNLNDYGKKPGWLWQKALEASGGDQLLAIQLIGICGHDDKMQLNGSGISISEKKRSYLVRLAPSHDQIFRVANFEANSRHLVDEDFESSLESYKRTLDDQFSIKNGVSCPEATSPFFGAGALGSEFDVNDDLKFRIAKVQSPTLGAKALPAKNYHIMGAAYSSCILFEHGVPGLISKKMAMGAINAYRSARVCEQLDYGEREPVERAYKTATLEDIWRDVIKVKKALDTDMFACQSSNTYGPLPRECLILEWFVFRDEISDGDFSSEIFRKKVSRRLSELDALSIFRRSAYFDKSHRCTGPQLSKAVRKFLEQYASSNSSRFQPRCPSYMSISRCQNARKVLDTYLVDFQWSEAQHLAGYNFAKEHCSPRDGNKTTEQVACEIERKKYNKENTTPGADTGSIK